MIWQVLRETSFNELKIIKIGHLEAEILDILILGSRSIDLYRKNSFFHFFSYMATDSIRYVKFINLCSETIWPQKPFFLGPQKKTFSSIDFNVKYCILTKLRKKEKLWYFIYFQLITFFVLCFNRIAKYLRQDFL